MHIVKTFNERTIKKYVSLVFKTTNMNTAWRVQWQLAALNMKSKKIYLSHFEIELF